MSHFSATASTETSFSRCVPESPRRRSVTTWISARMRCTSFRYALPRPFRRTATMTAIEQRAIEMLFQYLDAVGNGRR